MNEHELMETSEPTLFFDNVDEMDFDEFDAQDEFSENSNEYLQTYQKSEVVNDGTEKLPQKLSFDEVEEVNFEIENTDTEKSTE